MNGDDDSDGEGRNNDQPVQQKLTRGSVVTVVVVVVDIELVFL